jgi:hypothetical protein
MPQLSDEDQTKLAMAALFSALVGTLREQDQYLPSRFEENPERLYNEMKNSEAALEVLAYTRALLKHV